jgi:ubiquinol-cytochrome c reductase iron-sulfur subunit
MSNEPVRRRDWLVTAAFGMAGVGGVVALWPFVAAMGPDAETMAKRVTVNVDALKAPQVVTIGVGSIPVFLIKRTEEQLAALRGPQPYGTYRDRESVAPMQPAWAANWHRSLKPEIMICVPLCTYDPWMVLSRRDTLSEGTIMCPRCGSRYDLAGRVFKGLARQNLLVPPHRYVNASTIEFNETAVTQSTQALRGSPG